MPWKVLIIDDSALSRAELETAFAERGFEVVTASNGEQGLALAEAETPNIILLDIVMPNMGGWEACKRLRALTGSTRVPIIVMSGKDSSEDMLRTFEVGADEFLIKPMDEDELFDAVTTLLGGAPPPLQDGRGG